MSLQPLHLSWRLNAVGYGAKLTPQININHLLFADDINSISTSPEGLTILVNTLMNWNKDFKMRLSSEKSKVVSSEMDAVWPTSFDTDINTQQVQKCRYLGIEIAHTPRSTQKNYNNAIQAKARKDAQNRTRHCLSNPSTMEINSNPRSIVRGKGNAIKQGRYKDLRITIEHTREVDSADPLHCTRPHSSDRTRFKTHKLHY